jgi:hypothetical protein
MLMLHPRPVPAAVLALALVACSSAPPPLPSPPVVASTPTAAVPAPTASAASAVVPVSATPEAPSPFFVAYEQPYPGLRVFPMGKIALGVAGQFYLGHALRIDRDGVREDPGLFKGLEAMYSDVPQGPEEPSIVFGVMDASGDYPGSGSLSTNIPGDRGGTDYLFHLVQGVWKKTHEVPHTRRYNDGYYLGGLGKTAPWTAGRLLYEVYGADEIMEFDYDGAAGGTTIPRIAKAPPGLGCAHRIRKNHALASTPTQELFGAGQLCVAGDTEAQYMDNGSGKGPLAVERWAKGSKTSTIDTLPDQGGIRADGAETFLEARSGKDVLFGTTVSVGPEHGAAGKPYLAHFDGTQWRAISPVASGSLTDVRRREDGSLWIQVDDALWKRPSLAPDAAWTRITEDGLKELKWWRFTPDGAVWLRAGNSLRKRVGEGPWELVPLPARDSEGKAATYTPDRLEWVDDEAMVISDPQDDHSVTSAALLRTRKPTSVLRAAAGSEGNSVGITRVLPATAACKDTFVLLYKLARTAPADYDFPLTREALKGHTDLGAARLAETEEAGRRFLVAFVPTLALGQKVVKVVSEKVPSSRPQLLCGKPKVKRPLQLDFRTGNLVK